MTLQRGDALENAITGERGVVRYGTTESGGTLLVADLFIRHAAHSSFAEGS